VMRLVGADVDPNKAELPLIAENTPDKSESEEQRRRDDENGFYSKPIWQRSLVIFAGPFMSFVLGVFVFCNMGWTTGIPMPANKVGAVNNKSEAQRMGLKAGDRIIGIDDKKIATPEAMIDTIYSNCGKRLTVIVQRGSAHVELHGIPQSRNDDNHKPITRNGKLVGFFGFTPGSDTVRIGFAESWRRGIVMTGNWFLDMEAIFSHPSTIRQNTGSLITIGAVTHSAVEHGPSYIVSIAGQLTLSLALFNLLPIPILDGGHLLIFLIEALRRGRRLTPVQQQNFMMAGLVCIAILFVVVMSNDVLKVIHHTLPKFP